MFTDLSRRAAGRLAQYLPAAGLTALMGPARPAAAQPDRAATSAEGGEDPAAGFGSLALGQGQVCPPAASWSAVREAQTRAPLAAPLETVSPEAAPALRTELTQVRVTAIDARTTVLDQRTFDQRTTSISTTSNQEIHAGGSVSVSTNVVTASGDRAVAVAPTQSAAPNPDDRFGTGSAVPAKVGPASHGPDANPLKPGPSPDRPSPDRPDADRPSPDHPGPGSDGVGVGLAARGDHGHDLGPRENALRPNDHPTDQQSPPAAPDPLNDALSRSLQPPEPGHESQVDAFGHPAPTHLSEDPADTGLYEPDHPGQDLEGPSTDETLSPEP